MPTGDGSLASSHLLGWLTEHADTLREEDVEMVGGADGRSHFSIPQDSFVYLSRVGDNVLYVCTSLF